MGLWGFFVAYALLLPRVHTDMIHSPQWTCEPVGRGKATYYGVGDGFAGRTTANGETYVTNKLTAAHRSLPFNSWIRVSHQGKAVVVRINDRGPALWTGNEIDLSPAAFAELNDLKKGVLEVDLAICRI
jgi:rare lipoprotein A